LAASVTKPTESKVSVLLSTYNIPSDQAMERSGFAINWIPSPDSETLLVR
jgi:hypothetical protein